MTKHEPKHIEQTYQLLSEIEHVRKRTGMYAGSTAEQTSAEWVYDPASKKMVKREITYIPAFVKIFSEILDNAIDESRRAPDVLESIRVVFEDDGTISVLDNGRGIPVVIHSATGKYVAESIFSNLRAGSNFNDEEDQALIGTNGVGATLTNILSTKFRVESCDGTNLFRQDFWNGMTERSDPVVRPHNRAFTKITFTPDYAFFKLPGLTEDNRLRCIKKLVDAAACNPMVKFYVNSERIPVRDFDDYVHLYTDDYVTDLQADWKIGISESDGFEQVSFINSVETYTGGTHIDYVMIQITNKLREFIKRRHKVDVKPSEIRNHMRVYISANVNRPKFSSQTKDMLISQTSDYKTSWTVPDLMINRIVRSPIIQNILDWAQAKAAAEEMRELRAANRNTDKVNLKKVKKFHDATEKDRSKTLLALCEGDSAQSSILGARDPKLHATFPMRGRPINVSANPLSKVRENEEFENIRILIGLRYGEPAELDKLNFGKIVIASDADEFGSSIAGLIINMFYRLWPEIVKAGRLYRLVTPVVSVEYKKQELEFFTEHEFSEWRLKHEGERYEYAFLKGLGSSPPKAFKKYLQNLDKYMVQFEYVDKEDADTMDLCFLKDAGFSDKRKVWLDLE